MVRATELQAGPEMDAEIGLRVFGYKLVSLATLQPTPRYSTDVAAAWLVVEKMREMGLRPILMPDWGHQWQVKVYRESEHIVETAWFDTAPLAICRAALAALDSEP
jgi:hypothetical protein